MRSAVRTGVATMFLLSGVSARAANVPVIVGPGNTFNPPAVTVNPGDTVTWTFRSLHTATSDSRTGPEVWDSGFLSAGTFSHTFNTPGDYPYYCILHSVPLAQGGTFMNGAVHVAALLSTPPTILNVTPLGAFAGTTITINGAAFQNGATVTFRGVASPSVTFVNASTLQAVVPDIPIGAAHRVENPGDELMVFVEVQQGDYLGEDDIVRADAREVA